MPITFEEVSAHVEAPPPAAPAAAAEPAPDSPDRLAAQLEQALRLHAERLARLSAD